MTLPTFTMRQLLHAGVHFGHKTQRWNPRMSRYIFGEKNGIHIIDLQQTVPLLREALSTARDTVAQGGRLLFVGTKRQASAAIAKAAQRCGQYYINHRWLGGMLTNWKTISQSINRLRELDELLNSGLAGLTKKEVLHLMRTRDNLERSLGGIKDMGGLPDMLFIVDTIQEATAIREANRLGIPVAAILDSNSSDEGVTYPIPGNDDSTRSIELYCDLMSAAALGGIQAEMVAQGVDLGEKEETDVDIEEEILSTPKASNEDASDEVGASEENVAAIKEKSKSKEKKASKEQG